MNMTEIENGTILICRKEDLTGFAESLMNKNKATVTLPVKELNQIEPPITTAEAMKFVGKSRQTFYSWRKKGVVKAHILGGRVYYFKSEILANMK